MRRYGPIPEDYEETSDKASLPRPIRWTIRKLYGEDQLARIDLSGLYHDFLMDCGVDRDEARHEFIIDLYRNEVKEELILIIHFGISIYDGSPDWVRKLLKKTT